MTKKRAVLIIFAAAALLALLILLRGCTDAGPDLSDSAGRVAFLAAQGWEVDAESETYQRVLLPQTLEGALADYNALQQAQGLDLKKHLGQRCDQYCYLVTNYPDESQTVLAVLYVQGKKLIAGDIHSTAMNGFMKALITEK